MTRHILYLILLLLTISCTQQQENKEQQATETVTIATQISEQSRLYTTEYIVHKIVTYNDIQQLKGSFLGQSFSQNLHIGDRKIAIPIDVTLQAYIDFSLITEQHVQRKGNFLHITLPDLKVVMTSSKVNNQGIKTHVSLFRSHFTDAELTTLSQQGAASVLRTVPKMGIIESARNNAAAIIISLLSDMGYEEDQIIINFRKEFSEDDLPVIYDNENSVLKIKKE